ncbi:MAG: type IV pilus assembly protein FimV, partial [bacterium]
MIRKLALAVALAAGTLPLTALGLGLGDIKTHSALNQNFNADIQLLSVPVGELDGVKVSLGSNKAFNRAGVERPFFLTRLRFETVRNEDGTATIRVTSREPIREPFLDFLIEVNWPKGSMVKEYTVLLDPPTTTARRAPVVTPTRTVRSTPTPTRSAAPSRPAPATAMATAGQYGPVAPNETMWKIADRIRPQGVSVHQMMMALQEANPSAFINGNINLLKQGSILRIPETSSIAAIDNRQAASDFQQQTREWLSGTSAPVVKDRETTPTDTDTAPVAPVSRPSDTASDEAQLKIATADGTADSGVGAGTEGMSQDLMTAQEEAETARQSAEALEGEVGDLKSQVEDLQRLLALKDQQLAQLQSNIASDSAVDDADSMAGDSAAADDVEQAADTEMMASDTEAAAPEGGDVEGGDEPVVEEPAAVVEAPQQAVAEEPAAQPAMAAEAERSWLD